MMKTLVWIVAMFALTMSAAQAQIKLGDGQRPFDLISGIVFTCSSATGFRWTGEACDKLSAEWRKRGEANKLPFVEVPITADFSAKKRDIVNGFDQDKSVRVFWNFTADAKGSVTTAMRATRIWEPTAQEMPGIAPGQRFVAPFYIQQVIGVPGATYSQMESYLKIISDSFFEVGEKRR